MARGRTMRDWPERLYDPGEIDDLHEMRYRFASELVRGKRVLDAACGIGYGAPILMASGAASYVGADISADAVAAAREHYATNRVRFLQCDVFDAFHEGAFDIVVSLETIEHLERGDLWPEHVASRLPEDGIAVFSTPLRHGGALAVPPNPYHLREWNCEEFRHLIGASCQEVTVYFQGFGAPEVPGPSFARPLKRGLLMRELVTRRPRQVLSIDDWFEAYGCRPDYMVAVARVPRLR